MAKPIQRLLAFLPWLNIPATVPLAGVQFVPFRDRNGQTSPGLSDLEPSLKIILSGFVDLEGQAIGNCAIACIKEKSPIWDLSQDDQSTIQQAVQLLALAALSGNEYYGGGIGSYANTTSFQLLVQRFTEPPSWVSFQIRRRDGVTLDSGYKHGEVRIILPLACKVMRAVPIDEKLVEGLNKALNSDSSTMRRLIPALSFFNLANTDSDAMLPEAEAILTAAAFEQLLGTDGAYESSCEVGELLKSFGSVAAGAARSIRPGIALSSGYEAQQNGWFVHRKWAEELYDLRSKLIHGESLSKRTWGWSPAEHLVMGAFVFPLLVKLCLAREGHYTLDNEDQAKCRSIDPLLSKTEWHKIVGTSSIATLWRETILEAKMEMVHRKVAEALMKTDLIPEATSPAEGGGNV